MSINEIWQVRGNEWAWVMPNYCTLLDAAYLVLGEEPTSPGADHPGRVYKALSEMKTAIINNQGEYPYPYIDYKLTPFIRRDTSPESIKVSANFVRKWAERYKITDFFESSNPVNNQNENLLGQITAAEQLADNDKEFCRVHVEVRNYWEIHDPRDAAFDYPWWTAARYFAREFVAGDAKLLNKKSLLYAQISTRLYEVGIRAKTKNKKFAPGTIKKALAGFDYSK